MPPQTVTLKFTRHGPVVHEDAAKHRAFAVRSVWSEPGTSAYMGRLAYMTAQSVQQHGEALRHWSAPTVNQIAADVDGNIGWFAVGKAPRRPNWDGLLPVPGDGRYEWDGFHPLEDLPRTHQPAARLRRHRQRNEHPGRLPRAGAQARLRMGGAFARPTACTRCWTTSRGTAWRIRWRCNATCSPSRRSASAGCSAASATRPATWPPR